MDIFNNCNYPFVFDRHSDKTDLKQLYLIVVCPETSLELPQKICHQNTDIAMSVNSESICSGTNQTQWDAVN